MKLEMHAHTSESLSAGTENDVMTQKQSPTDRPDAQSRAVKNVYFDDFMPVPPAPPAVRDSANPRADRLWTQATA